MGARHGLSSRWTLRDPADRRRALAVALLALVASSGVQCVQDLVVSPPQGTYALIAVSPQIDTVNIGDTLAFPTVRLTLNGTTAAATYRAEVVSGGAAVQVDSAAGRLIVLGPGDAVVRIYPENLALPVDTLRLDFTLHAAVPVLASAGQDSIFSLKDTLALTAAPRSLKGVLLTGIPVHWQVVSGGSSVTLLDSTSGTAHVRAEANGDAVLKAVTDSATVTRTVRVRQRAASIIPAGAILFHWVGQSRQLAPQVRDARTNLVASPALTYVSRNTAVATVGGVGLVTAVGDGTTRIVTSASGPGGGSAADSSTVVVQMARLTVLSGNGQWASVGATLPAPLAVKLVDAGGGEVADSFARVVFRVTAGSGRFGGVDSAVVLTDVLGHANATLTLGADVAPTSVQVTGAGLGGGAVTFTETPAPPARLRITVQPSAVPAGGSITPAVKVEVRDTFNTVVPSVPESVSVAIVPGTGTSGVSLLGATKVATTAGVAMFSSLTLDRVGTGYRLIASAAGLASDTTAPFNVTAGAPDHLAFVVQPSRVAVDAANTPAIQVAIQDAGNNVVTATPADVTLSLSNIAAAGAQAYGSLTATTASGVATFTNVKIDKPAVGYTLRASTALSGVKSVESLAFTVAGAPASIVIVSGNNQNNLAGATVAPFVVRVTDAAGTPVQSDSVILKVTAGGGNFSGHDSVIVLTDVSGLASAALTLGPATGTNSATARSVALGAGSTVTFSASATAADVHLAFVVQPTNASAGIALSPAIQVAIQDASNVTVTGASTIVTLAISSGTGTAGAQLSGTLQVAAVNGIATFGNVSVDKVGTGYRLTASAYPATAATSGPFDVAAGAASRVAFTGSPQNGTAGASLGAITVSITDAGGNVVASATNAVTVALGGGTPGAHLRGTKTVTAVAGVPTFTGLSVDSAGTGYTLVASAGGLSGATSGAFAIQPAPPDHLVFSVQPASVTAAVAMAPAVVVLVEDSLGNVVTTAATNVTLSIGANPGSATLGGTSTVSAVNGVATFSNLRLNRTGSGYTLAASATGLTGATSSAFAVTAAPAVGLTFAVSPSDALIGVVIAPPVVVWVVDSLGNRVTAATNAVTLAITGGTGGTGATLAGTTTVSAVSGVATFSNLDIAMEGNGYTLTATASGLASAVSAAFNILTATTNRYVFTVQPPASVVAGAAMNPAVVVTVKDGSNNTVTGFTDSVTVALTHTGKAGAAFRPGATTKVMAVAGVATFGNLRVDSVGVGYGLTASGGTPSSGTSSTFAVDPGPPAQLVFLLQPSSRTAGNVFSPAIRVAVLDSVGNVVPTASQSVSLAITSGSGATGAVLAGTATQTPVSGVATFDNVSIAKAGVGYTLTATAAGITAATSTSFSITPGSQVRVTPAGASIATAGGTQQFTATDSLGNAVSGVTWSSLNPNVATVNSSTGVATAVTSGQVTIAATAGGVTGYAVLTVAIPGAVPVNLWAPMASGTTARLWGIWGASGSSVFAGADAAGLFLFDGTTWTVSNSSSRGFGLWGSSPTDVFAVGGDNIAHFDGTRWSSAGISGCCWGIWGTSPRDVYAVGFSGLIVHYNGTTWTPMTSGTSAELRAIWGSSASDIWAVGRGGVIVHYDGTHWSSVASPPTGDLYAMWGFSAGEVYAIGQGAVRYNGSSWSTLAAWGNSGLWGSSGSDLYSVQGNVVRRYDGTSAQTATLALGGNHLNGIWGTSASDVYAVGDSGTVLRGVRGATVTVAPASPTITALGATQQMAASAKDASSHLIAGVAFVWSSSDTTKVRVDSTGKVTAVANGAATITVTVPGGASGSTTVTVSVSIATSRFVAGIAHSCSLSANGVAYCWGDNPYSQLGDGTSTRREAPVPVSTAQMFQSLTAGDYHTCGLTSGGAAYCWGRNSEGQLGDGTQTGRAVPVAVSTALVFQSLSAGGNRTCGVTSTGLAYCWGWNGNGQLGDGTTTQRTTPVAVSTALVFQSLTAGTSHTCGLTSAGAAYCWGGNDNSQLGDGTTTQRTTPVAVSTAQLFQSLTAGGSHTCGLTSAGAAYCWGWNAYGQLGDGTGSQRTTPVAVSTAQAFQSLAAGASHTCGLTSVGVAYCWGYNALGQLGDGTMTPRTTPVAVNTARVFQSLAAGANHTCGRTSSGAAYCWGLNASGQLGLGEALSSTVVTPAAVNTGQVFQSVTSGGGHTCGLTSGGAAYCWGSNGLGQLGDGTTTQRMTPVAVSTGQVFQALIAYADHNCGLTSGGAAYCWGGGLTAPVAVGTAQVFQSIAVGAGHACGLTSGGAAYCWGRNAEGQLGDGTTTSRDTLVAVSTALAFKSLTAGDFHTCGVTTSGAAYCWGGNPGGQLTSGQLGDGTTTMRTTPVAVSTALVFQTLFAGGNHTCGLTGGGTAYCWGDNSAGDLGDGTWIMRNTPVAVSTTQLFQSLTMGGNATCGVTTGGAAYCWGDNSWGNLGDGTTSWRLTPEAVSTAQVFQSLADAGSHTCGVTTGGTAFCWGDNTFGQLGLGYSGTLVTPVAVTGGITFLVPRGR